MTDVAVIIPQYGQSDLTIAAVNSLQQHHPVPPDILIVDDGSPAQDRTALQTQLEGRVSVLRLPRRQGVTAAWNYGANASRAKILVFLNNDVVTNGPWMDSLIAPVLSSCCRISGVAWRSEKGLQGNSLKLLQGWCLAIERETLLALGGFDHNFRLYFSDTDLQLRALRSHSDSLTAVAGLPLAHLGHRSTCKLKSRTQEWRRDHRYFLKKWRDHELTPP